MSSAAPERRIKHRARAKGDGKRKQRQAARCTDGVRGRFGARAARRTQEHLADGADAWRGGDQYSAEDRHRREQWQQPRPCHGYIAAR